jgi:ABC-type Fe3+ transport system substrate-binding protein
MKTTIVGLFTLLFTASVAGAQTQEQLIAGAKKEGKLVVYASATAPQLQMYFAAFNKRYPFIKTEFFRTGKQALVNKILIEEKAKQRFADVVHTSVIETNKIEWFAMLLKLKGRPFMEKLAALNPSVRSGNTLALQLLAAGEFPISAGVYEYSVEDMKMKGAPVDWIGLEPVITYTVALSLPSQPNNLNSAKLFIEWLLSKEGQAVVNRYGRVPIRDDVDSKYGKILKAT